LKLKSLAVITLLVLGCSAAFGQSYSFGFLSYDQSTQYCDYEVLAVSAPYAAGVHNLNSSCGLPLNAVMVGLATSQLKASSGAPVYGNVYALADSSADAEYIGVSGLQFDFITKLKAATPAQLKAGGPFGWSFYLTFGGGTDYLGNWGFLTTQLGATAGGKIGSTGTSFGALAKKFAVIK
jgi:hypothetical protein